MATKRREYHKRLEQYFKGMYETYKTMPDEEREALEKWEEENLHEPGVATSDWPGWVKYIGHPPWKDKE